MYEVQLDGSRHSVFFDPMPGNYQPLVQASCKVRRIPEAPSWYDLSIDCRVSLEHKRDSEVHPAILL